MATGDERATSFGQEAGTYESGRPEYPVEATTWLLSSLTSEGHVLRVADLGAGTGKLTRAVLASAPAQVVAIDPDQDMLNQLSERVPGVPTFVGAADSIPLPDAGLDALVCGQAWHWFDPESASAEIARVLRVGGILGLIWNVRDARVQWVRDLTAAMSSSAAEEMLERVDDEPSLLAREPFVRDADERWEWNRVMSRESIFTMAHSRSNYITADADDRAVIDARIGEVLDEIGLVGGAAVEMPYVTRAFRFVRAS